MALACMSNTRNMLHKNNVLHVIYIANNARYHLVTT